MSQTEQRFEFSDFFDPKLVSEINQVGAAIRNLKKDAEHIKSTTPKRYTSAKDVTAAKTSQKELNQVLSQYEAIQKKVAELDRRIAQEKVKQTDAVRKKVVALDKEKTTTKKVTQADREREKAAAELEKQRKRGLEQLAKQEDKERQLIETANMQVKSIEDLRTKTNAMLRVRDRLDLSTAKGKAEFARLTTQIKANSDQLQKAEFAAGRYQRNVGKYWSALQGGIGKLLPMLGMAGGLAGALTIAKNVISSTNAAGDRLAVVMGGIKTGTQKFFQVLATGDFGNFLENIQGAVDVGREYVRVMDDVADRQLMLTIRESKSRIEILENQKILRDYTKSHEERIAAADRVLEIEKENAQTRIDIAQQAFDAELTKQAALAEADQKKILHLIEEYDSYSDLISAADEYLAKEKELQSIKPGPISGMYSQRDQARRSVLQDEIEGTDQAVKDFMQTYKGYLTLTDEQRKAIGDSAKQLYDAQASFDQMTMRTESRRSRLLNQVENQTEETSEEVKTIVQEEEDFLNQLLDNIEQKQKIVDERIAAMEAARQVMFDVPMEDDPELSPEIKRIMAEEQYKRELFKETYEYKKKALADALRSGEIGWTEYTHRVTELHRQEITNYIQSANEVMGQMTGLLNAQASVYQNIESRKLEDLQARLTAGLLSEQEYETEKEKIQKEYGKKRQQIEVATATMQGANAVLNALNTQPWWVGLTQAIVAMGMVAQQINTIKSQKFGKGEVDIRGRKHSQGGIPAEIEGGESVINAKATAQSKQTLELINAGLLTDDIVASLSLNRLLPPNNVDANLLRKTDKLIGEAKRTNELLSRWKWISEDGKTVIDMNGNRIKYV
jgi:hypothetical protein